MITKRIAGKNEGWEINIKRTKYNTTCTWAKKNAETNELTKEDKNKLTGRKTEKPRKTEGSERAKKRNGKAKKWRQSNKQNWKIFTSSVSWLATIEGASADEAVSAEEFSKNGLSGRHSFHGHLGLRRVRHNARAQKARLARKENVWNCVNPYIRFEGNRWQILIFCRTRGQ